MAYLGLQASDPLSASQHLFLSSLLFIVSQTPASFHLLLYISPSYSMKCVFDFDISLSGNLILLFVPKITSCYPPSFILYFSLSDLPSSIMLPKNKPPKVLLLLPFVYFLYDMSHSSHWLLNHVAMLWLSLPHEVQS